MKTPPYKGFDYKMGYKCGLTHEESWSTAMDTSFSYSSGYTKGLEQYFKNERKRKRLEKLLLKGKTNDL